MYIISKYVFEKLCEKMSEENILKMAEATFGEDNFIIDGKETKIIKQEEKEGKRKK